jgi:DNA-binding PucR family transcriptional regulator
MKEYYGIDSIVQGFSGLHSDFMEIEKSYKEALTVLSMKKIFPFEVTNTHSYQNLGFYRYLVVLSANEKKAPHENDSLKKLNEYDRKYNNNLIETLEVYLNKDCNVRSSAKSLNIHPNTLSYRIRRISEIGEVDLKDITQKMTLFLDLKLKKLS